jgi:hypothetical protein
MSLSEPLSDGRLPPDNGNDEADPADARLVHGVFVNGIHEALPGKM